MFVFENDSLTAWNGYGNVVTSDPKPDFNWCGNPHYPVSSAELFHKVYLFYFFTDAIFKLSLCYLETGELGKEHQNYTRIRYNFSNSKTAIHVENVKSHTSYTIGLYTILYTLFSTPPPLNFSCIRDFTLI